MYEEVGGGGREAEREDSGGGLKEAEVIVDGENIHPPDRQSGERRTQFTPEFSSPLKSEGGKWI